MTVPAEAKFSTADRLNTPEPEATKEEILAEALRIVRGETMMRATKKHLVALAELNQELGKSLTDAYDFYMGPHACGDFTCSCNTPSVCGMCEIRIATEKILGIRPVLHD